MEFKMLVEIKDLEHAGSDLKLLASEIALFCDSFADEFEQKQSEGWEILSHDLDVDGGKAVLSVLFGKE